MKYGAGCALALTLIVLSGCTTAPPRDQGNLCNIYRQYPRWYEDSLAMQKQWGMPVQVAMAIMKQESSFVADALPPRAYLLWVIPWGRVSDSYGYAQAQPPAWNDYKKSTGNGGSRDNFADAIMFIGWYAAGAAATGHLQMGCLQTVFGLSRRARWLQSRDLPRQTLVDASGA